MVGTLIRLPAYKRLGILLWSACVKEGGLCESNRINRLLSAVCFFICNSHMCEIIQDNLLNCTEYVS